MNNPQPPFPTNDLSELVRIKSNLTSKRASSMDPEGLNKDFTIIEKESKKNVFSVKGAGMINHIWITMATDDEKNFSRNDLIIRIYWDNNEYPSVEAPLGPFFGQGWDESYMFQSLLLSASPQKGNAMVSYINMPYAEGARIEIENQNECDITKFYFYIDYVEMDRLPKDCGRFHAWYNHELTEADPDGENEWSILGDPKHNLTGDGNYLIADIKGKGHYIGVNYFIHSPTPVWYGEGNDMFFIDGDELPTIKGTGTEDYFNTAWSPKTAFNHPYYGAPRVNEDIDWLGRTHVYRFHITDPIYFNESLKFTIEHAHANALTLDLASVAYWYQSEAASVPAIPSKEERKPKPPINGCDIHKWRHEWRKAKGSKRTLWGNE